MKKLNTLLDRVTNDIAVDKKNGIDYPRVSCIAVEKLVKIIRVQQEALLHGWSYSTREMAIDEVERIAGENV